MDVPLLLLAAGRSTRFGTLKQVAPAGPGGASILAYTVADGLLAGFSRVVVVVRPEIEGRLREHLRTHLGDGLPLAFVHQAEPLGTAHAALVGLAGVDGPAGLANGDDAYGRDALRQLRRSAEQAVAEADGPVRCALVAYPIADTLSAHGGVSRGWVRAEGEAVTSIREAVEIRAEAGALVGQGASGERLPLPPDALGSMNLWMLGSGTRPLLTRAFERFRQEGEGSEFMLSDVLGEAAEDGAVAIRLAGTATGWFGLTFAEDLPDAQARLAAAHRDGHYAATLAKTVAPVRRGPG